jgi:prolipoprotein diacylglyceryltransferase
MLFTYMALYAVFRFLLEMLRGDAVRGVYNMLSTSQIISLFLLSVSVIGLAWKRKPSVK